jgi:hypothetical protein
MGVHLLDKKVMFSQPQDAQSLRRREVGRDDLAGSLDRARQCVFDDACSHRLLFLFGQHRDDAVHVQSMVAAKVRVGVVDAICERVELH